MPLTTTVPQPAPPVPERRGGYIPTLDGWRALAVAGVILFHGHTPSLLGHSLAPLQDWGEHGVQLFFAISGLLICTRLLDERRLSGHISLGAFYVRRLFRIQPAALVFLATVVLLSSVHILHTSRSATLASLLCYRNYFNALSLHALPDDRYTSHFWSLAVEEHFYLLLPALLLVSRRRLLPVVAALSVLAMLWVPSAHVLHLSIGSLAQQRTDLSLQDLFVPALLAVLLTDSRFREHLTAFTRHGVLLVAVPLALGVSELFLRGRLTHQLTCVGFPLLLLSTVLHPSSVIGRLLESRPLLFLGRISYSLYLWQQLFFIRRPELSLLHYLQVFPVNFISLLACATASYYLVERPLIKLGHRFAPPATPGRPDLKGDVLATPPAVTQIT